MTPIFTYQVLLIIQALHLLHHRIAKRHISLAEAVTALVLCIPPYLAASNSTLSRAMMITHGVLGLTQIIGTLFIRKLSPDWQGQL